MVKSGGKQTIQFSFLVKSICEFPLCIDIPHFIMSFSVWWYLLLWWYFDLRDLYTPSMVISLIIITATTTFKRWYHWPTSCTSVPPYRCTLVEVTQHRNSAKSCSQSVPLVSYSRPRSAIYGERPGIYDVFQHLMAYMLFQFECSPNEKATVNYLFSYSVTLSFLPLTFMNVICRHFWFMRHFNRVNNVLFPSLILFTKQTRIRYNYLTHWRLTNRPYHNGPHRDSNFWPPVPEAALPLCYRDW